MVKVLQDHDKLYAFSTFAPGIIMCSFEMFFIFLQDIVMDV